MDNPKLYILQLIPDGELNGITAKDLTALIGEKTDRETRAVISNLRLSGILVCCGNHGYFMPETREEVIRYVKRMQSQAESILKVIEPAKEWLRETEGQLSLDDIEED